MGPIDLLWHLLNLLAPSVSLALVAAALAKALWRHELAGVAWAGLARWAAMAATAALLGGLVLLGRDGRMATYAAMVLATAIALWWRGWWRRGRR
jgi:hypothetical protein